MKKKLFIYTLTTSAIGFIPYVPAFATVPAFVTVPDAGQTTQQLKQIPDLPKTDDPTLSVPAVKSTIQPGGAQVVLKSIRFTGNSLYTIDQLNTVLNAVLGDVTEISYDLAGLNGIANLITRYYRDTGYPFARAYLPAQSMKDGVLKLEIVEGRYGQVSATGEDKTDNEQATKFLTSLKSNSIIESAALERATLILSDQAGIKTIPIMQPGKDFGMGDLVVEIKRDKPYTGSVKINNHGNYYTGQNIARANLNINSPFMLGDQITLDTLYSEEGMWLGNLGYNLPINGNGLRANFGYSRTDYQLGKDFKTLNAKGTADIVNIGLSYQLIRSQKTNINLLANIQHKDLNDDLGSGNPTHRKNSNSLPLSVSFDTRDSLGGGGITFGAITWTKGTLNLSNTLKKTDTNKTHGDFDKLTIDLIRLQALPENFSLYLRASSQWSNKNLDSSEGFGIGGNAGVRAYPTSEGYGNVGWVTQTELRYSLNENVSSYIFYDVGGSTANQFSIGTNPVRELSGAGVGFRYAQKNWSFDISAAWRIDGGKPEDENMNDEIPRLWGNLSYHF